MWYIASIAETPSATTVVVAEQIIPNPKKPIKITSKSAFNIAEKAKNLRGVLVSPALFKPAASVLYIKVKGVPKNVIQGRRRLFPLSRLEPEVN